MAAKQNREKRNFEQASQARETLIKRLTECQSPERLRIILGRLEKEKNKSQSPFKIGDLTDYHAAEIKKQDEQIDRLIAQKQAQFPNPEASVLVDTSAVADSVEEPLSFSELIARALADVADPVEERVLFSDAIVDAPVGAVAVVDSTEEQALSSDAIVDASVEAVAVVDSTEEQALPSDVIVDAPVGAAAAVDSTEEQALPSDVIVDAPVEAVAVVDSTKEQALLSEVIVDTSVEAVAVVDSTEEQALLSEVIVDTSVEAAAVVDSTEGQVLPSAIFVDVTEDLAAALEPADNTNALEEPLDMPEPASIHDDRMTGENAFAPDVKETSAPACAPVTANKEKQTQSDARFYKSARCVADDFNHARAQELCAVRDQLNVLKAKGKSFCKRSDNFRDNNQPKNEATYKNAAKSVAVIYRNIDLLCSDYEYNRINLDAFKAGCETYLKNDNQDVVVANTHRQYKEVLANLLIAATGVGLLAMAALSIYNGRFTLFKVAATDTGNKVHDLRDSIACVR